METRERGKQQPFEKGQEIATPAGLISGEISCAFCDGRHEAERCLKARNMTNEEKTERLRKSNLCFYCMQPCHGKKKCPILVKYFLCNGNHHSLMCRGERKKTKKDSPQHESQSENISPVVNPENVTKISSTTSLCSSDVLLNILQTSPATLELQPTVIPDATIRNCTPVIANDSTIMEEVIEVLDPFTTSNTNISDVQNNTPVNTNNCTTIEEVIEVLNPFMTSNTNLSDGISI
ncbi:unnamed protein product [Orchesella dallaii]|uniref:Uncharacterized protein n=1 Tax=Orchesella dallaii TaxID=48710 RepID=A0ABP1PXI8_9HEXA